jgi:dihydrofolate reductase
MKNLSIIVALALNNGIGKDNKLLTFIPGDLPRFKIITSGKTVIMGKNTFLSLPHGPLKNRKNLVISDDQQDHFDGCITVFSLKEAIDQCDNQEEIFVIGGASIYRQFLPYATKLYLTLINKNFEADTFFPEINQEEWLEISREIPKENEKLDFTYEYVVLQRKN